MPQNSKYTKQKRADNGIFQTPLSALHTKNFI